MYRLLHDKDAVGGHFIRRSVDWLSSHAFNVLTADCRHADVALHCALLINSQIE